MIQLLMLFAVLFTPLSTAAPMPPSTPARSGRKNPRRPLGMIVVRESDLYDKVMFLSMLDKTYSMLMHLPGVREIRAVGLLPMTGCETFPVTTASGKEESIKVYEDEDGRTKITYFYYRGYWHVWSMSSAAKKGRPATTSSLVFCVTSSAKLRPRPSTPSTCPESSDTESTLGRLKMR